MLKEVVESRAYQVVMKELEIISLCIAQECQTDKARAIRIVKALMDKDLLAEERCDDSIYL